MSKLFPVLASTLLVAVSSPSLANDANAVAGNVVVAKGGAHPLLVWDASPVVTALTSSKTPHDKALAQLESDAVSIANARLSQLTSAHDVTVRVVYMKMGAVNPMYGAPTLEGVEKLLTLQASQSELAAQGAAWVTQLSSQKIPHGLTLSVTGQLPPV